MILDFWISTLLVTMFYLAMATVKTYRGRRKGNKLRCQCQLFHSLSRLKSKFVAKVCDGKKLKEIDGKSKWKRTASNNRFVFGSVHKFWICVAMLLHMMKSCEAFDKLPNGNGCENGCSRTGSLGGVVDEWIKGGAERATVVAKYGEIEIWDTSDVRRMDWVFYNKNTFNEDISKWDVSSVTNMQGSTSLSFFLSFCSCIHKHILNNIYSDR